MGDKSADLVTLTCLLYCSELNIILKSKRFQRSDQNIGPKNGFSLVFKCE
jgi:hypothetical protein